jgi:hypothetical protein
MYKLHIKNRLQKCCKINANHNGDKHCHRLTVPRLTLSLDRWPHGVTELTANATRHSTAHQLH